MYDFCYNVYFALKRIQRRLDNPKSFLFRATSWLIGYIEAYYNLLFVKWLRKSDSNVMGINQRPREKKIIASLTSYPARIDNVWITIETIFRQTVKADAVELWLAKEQFNSLDSVPSTILQLQNRGLSIRFCDDLKSHKKYFYSMQEHKDDIVILFDDDLFYPSDTIKKLLEMHRNYPSDICCITAQHIGDDWTSMPSTWRKPYLFENNEHSSMIQVYTGSGSLYPPGVFYEDVFNKRTMLDLCSSADDLWLTFMAHLNGTHITSLNKWRPFPVEIYGTAKNSLWHINSEKGMNDVQWANLLSKYNEQQIKERTK